MKKCLLILTTVLCLNTIKAQVLYTENFDNYNIGNLGTDPTGVTPGQGGWYTYSKYTKVNGFFTISSETGKGKVLNLNTSSVNNEILTVVKEISYATIANRLPRNDVFMFEIDYYTGLMQPPGSVGSESQIEIFSRSSTGSYRLAYSYFDKSTGSINNNGKLPFNTWIKFIFYIDYPNRKDYLHIPYLNKVYVNDRLNYLTSPNLIQDFPISGIQLSAGYLDSSSSNPLSTYIRNRYDNIKITALNAVPPGVIALSVDDILSEKFNLYPNPATNVVNITNSENHLVNQVVVYDVAGKQLSTQTFNNKSEIQLNIENLASGSYFLHIKTNQGTAVKKLIKE